MWGGGGGEWGGWWGGGGDEGRVGREVERFRGGGQGGRRGGGLPLPIGGRDLGTPLEHLDEVEAELGAHRFADLAGIELAHGLLEGRHGVSGVQSAAIDSATRGCIDRVLAGKVGIL